MRIPVNTYQIVCDGCGELFRTQEDFTCYCDDPNRIETDADESKWIITSDGHHYCPNCYDWSDEDVCETKDGKKYNGEYEPITMEE